MREEEGGGGVRKGEEGEEGEEGGGARNKHSPLNPEVG
jgi:hypothetical protein